MARLFNEKHTHHLLYTGMAERTFSLEIQWFEPVRTLNCPIICIGKQGKALFLKLHFSCHSYKLEFILQSFFLNSRIFFSICCITHLKSSSVFPVGSSSFQLSSNALPINGQPTSQPMEMEMSGSGMLDISLEYCFFSMSMP
jgi:hypothetical protein